MKTKFEIKKGKFFVLAFVLFALTIAAKSNFAQCSDLIKKQGIEMLDPYIHDGHFNAIKMVPGEDVDMVKTFFTGQSYMVVICADPNLPQPEFTITDDKGKEVFSNRKKGELEWEFTPKKSQRLTINVKIPHSETKQNVSGCVGIVVGFDF